MKTIEVKTSELEGAALDFAVAVAIGEDRPRSGLGGGCCVVANGHTLHRFCPSTEWAHGGPLIAANQISIIYTYDDPQPCAWTDDSSAWPADTPLIAACRALVADKLGETVSVPKELMK